MKTKKMLPLQIRNDGEKNDTFQHRYKLYRITYKLMKNIKYHKISLVKKKVFPDIVVKFKIDFL